MNPQNRAGSATVFIPVKLQPLEQLEIHVLLDLNWKLALLLPQHPKETARKTP
ncbi:hypothetical protein HanPSC8_Chr03g0086871 [Helianthus annuus]|nr:hypothetical protein HanPSC8_Chr03g0086871 [Helianthus annuus]